MQTDDGNNSLKFSKIILILALFLMIYNAYGNTQTKEPSKQNNQLSQSKLDHIEKIEVHINGIKNTAIVTAIRSNLSLLRYTNYAKEDLNHLKLFYNSIPEEVKSTLINFGYFNPTITTTIKDSDHIWQVDIDVSLNQATIIDKISISTIPENPTLLEELKKKVALKINQPLMQDAYTSTKSHLLNYVNDRGFLDAKLTTSKILIDKTQNKAEIVFQIDLKKRYRYGKITIKQRKYYFKPTFLKKFITFHKDELYEMDEINKTQKQLDNSAYFDSVAIVPSLQQRDSKNAIVPIKIILTARDQQAYSIGVGYGTFTGPRATLGATYPHLSDTGHNAQAQLQISSINTSFLTQYIIPGSNPVNTYWSLNAQQSLYDFIPYQALETIIGINWVKTLKEFFTINLGLHQYLVRYNTQADSSNVNSKYLVPSLSLSYTLKKPDGFFDNGLMLNDLVQASHYLNYLSDQSFIRNLVTARYAFGIIPQWMRFISSANFGALNINDIQSIAPEFRFYAGGIGTLLGYAYLSQGPEIAGNLTGGRYLLTTSAGIEQRIYGNLSTIVYYNVGNAFNQFNSIEPLHAAGIGLSWKSPLGPIIGYLTRTLNAGDEHWRFDFSIGTYF